jgi:hypothetical protein
MTHMRAAVDTVLCMRKGWGLTVLLPLFLPLPPHSPTRCLCYQTPARKVWQAETEKLVHAIGEVCNGIMETHFVIVVATESI